MRLPSTSNVDLTALCRNGQLNEAVHILLNTHNLSADSTTYLQLLQACILKNALSQGKNVHSFIAHWHFAFATRTSVHNNLINLYVKCGSLGEARKVFDQMSEPDVCSWNTMLAAYRRHGLPQEAVRLFHQMRRTNLVPDRFTFGSVIPACAQMGALKQGMDIHRSIQDSRIESNVVVGTALVDMYAKCGSMDKASELFDKMPLKDPVSWNAMIAGCVQNGIFEKALEIFKRMRLEGFKPNSATFASILPACAKMGALEQGIDIHQCLVEGGFLSEVAVASALVDMYAKCGSIDRASKLFDRMLQRDVISWNAIIVGYTRNGLVEKALETFKQMKLAGVNPDSTSFASILPACSKMGALEQGMDIHQSILEAGLSSDVVVVSALVDMYAKCGSIDKACELFGRMPQKDVISWNAMILGYAQNGLAEKAVEIFKQMKLAGVKPNSTTFSSILPACAKMGDLEQGMEFHQSIADFGLLSDVVVASALIDMYAKCGHIDKARELFDKMHKRNVVSWNAMIAGYAQNGFVEKALEMFKQMHSAGFKPNSTTFATILPACAKIGALEQGIDMHQSIMEGGVFSDVVVASALLDMYAKCGSIHKARELFDRIPQRNVFLWTAMFVGYAQNGVLDEASKLFHEMPQRDVVSWSAMIAGYAQKGLVEKALETFKQMQLAGVKPTTTIFACVLSACAKVGELEQGIGFHRGIIESGFLSVVLVANALIDMYAKCGSVQKARNLFDKLHQKDVISWNSMIAGYAQHGFPDEASRLFEEMPQRDVVSWSAMIAGYAQNGLVGKALDIFKQMQLAGVKPNPTTFASILTACAKMGALEQGMDIHQSIMASGVLSDVVLASTLIGMYAKCGSMDKAQELFDKMPQKNVVSWTTMFTGYAQNGLVEKALKIFKEMQLKGVKPDPTAFASVLPACAKIGALQQGMEFHQRIIESGFLSHVSVVDALIDMYAKCGSIQKARELFDKMPQREVVSWNATIAGYAMHGYGKDALKLFDLMKHSGTQPDQITFISVLFACSHAGLVNEGCKYLNAMNESYCIMPDIDHYVCMVDLLGRAGYLEETLNFIIKMPIKPAVVVWMCFLGSCRSHKSIRLGVFTTALLLELDPKSAVPYVLLSDIYAKVGRWGDVQKIRSLMKDREVKKMPGCSWIEVHKTVHAFCVRDKYASSNTGDLCKNGETFMLDEYNRVSSRVIPCT